MRTLRRALGDAEPVADRSVLDAFSILWRQLTWSRQLVEGAERSVEGRRDLQAVLAFSDAIVLAGEGGDASVAGFLESQEAGQEGPGMTENGGPRELDGVHVLTAHATAGLEFDTVFIIGTTEGNFPSLARPEPMFDLALLDRPVSQSDRNRERLEDERRLFDVVVSRARRRVVCTASDPHGEDPELSARSRFVAASGVRWQPAPEGLGGPIEAASSVVEASATWRRALADPELAPSRRFAALDGLLALGDRPERWWFQRDWTGTDRPLHESIRVSFSKLDKLENCALQFVLSEELGLEGAAGYYAWVGQLVHRLIEDCEAGHVARTEEALVAEAERRWRPQEFPSFAVSEAFRRTVTGTMLPMWLSTYGEVPALAGERRFTFELDGASVTGIIDRVGRVLSGGSQITDYKTGKARGTKAEESLQLGVYFLAVNRADELAEFRPVKAVELAFLKDRTKEGSMARAQVGMNSRDREQFERGMVERLSGLIDRIRELLRTERYRPNPAANCRFCDFKALCPLWPEGQELFAGGRR